MTIRGEQIRRSRGRGGWIRHCRWWLPGLLMWAGVTGCDRVRAPEPPQLRAELVRDLFVSLEQRDYERAAVRVARLRELQPDNVCLGELDHAVRHNGLIQQLQAKLVANDLAGAQALLTTAIRAHGRHETLLAAQKTVDRLVELDGLVAICVTPPDSVALAHAAARLKTLAGEDEELAAFRPLADIHLERARELSAWERRRAVDDLCSTIDLMWSGKDGGVAAALAVLATTDPGHPTVIAWETWLADENTVPPLTYAAEP